MRQLKMRFKLIPLIWIVLKVQVLLAAQIDDLTALQRLYQVTDGPRWRNSTNWMSDTSVCTWFGITCDASSNVQGISLSQNNLVGRVAKLIYRMRHLTQIDMKDNTLRDGDFTGFADVTESNLHLLDLSGNSLTSLKGIGDAPKSLKQLHLTANKLGGPIPVELFGLTQLTELFLSFNHFTGTLPSEIGEMEALEKLYLYGSDLSGNIPTEVGRLQRMRVLTLSENNFTGSLSNDVSGMINLEVFAIHNSQMKKGSLSGPLPWFHKSPFLADLKLDGNSFTGSIPSQFLQVSNLTSSMVTIGLSQNLLTGSLPTSLLKFSSLNLDVTGNRISFVDPLFCRQTSWMIGQVEELGCDALLCPKGTWNMFGRATKVENCTECPSTSSYYGSMACEDNSSQEIKDWIAIGKLYEALDGSSWNETYGWSEFDALLDSTNWVDTDTSSRKYCSWYGVECSDGNTIISLRLSKNGLVGTLPSEVLGMTGLKILDLSLNAIELDITSGLSGLEKAKALSYLDLSGTKISSITGIARANALSEIYLDSLELPTGSIPSELFTMTSLRTLQMQSSGLAGTIPTEIGKLTRLKRLLLFKNNLSGPLPTEIGHLKDMVELDFAMNRVSGEIPSELSEMKNLRRLTIHNVNGMLSGKLPAFDSFPDLEELSFENNKLSGSIPSSFLQGIRNKSKFLYVNIAHNQLSGTIPNGLVDFEALDIMLEGNKITGIDNSLCSKSLWMDGTVGKLNNNCDAILCPKGTFNSFGKLGVTGDASCIECLTAAYFGSVSCEGQKINEERMVLDNLFRATGGKQWHRKENWTKVGVPICLREGIVCNGKNDEFGVVEIELLNNNLKGEIPDEIFSLPYIKLLSFTDNQVQLSFQRISEAKKLVTLKISNADVRSLDGIGQASNTLSEVHLAGNQFKGTIPIDLFTLTNLKQLFLSYNLFIGSVPSEIGMLTKIQDLDLHGNFLTGFIPTELGNLKLLSELDMSKNMLSGNLPLELNGLPLLQSISFNNQKSDKLLTGSLLSFLSTSVLTKLDLSYNDLSGTIPDNFLASCPENGPVMNINLRHNRLSGSISSSLSKFNFLNIDLAENELIHISDEACLESEWMDGKVSSFGCDAILCKPGYFAPDGKQISTDQVCQQCPPTQDAPFYGSTECRSYGIDANSERDILVAFYDALNGTNWVDQTNWNSDKSHCTWFGIVCNEDGFVSEINLESNGLEADNDISSFIFKLEFLLKLDLKGNHVPLHLKRIPTNSKLNSMILSSTGQWSTKGISNAKAIQSLHLTDNGLTGTFPEEILKLTKLTSLFLSFNSFNGTIPSHISKLSNLEEFYAFGNKFTGTLPNESISKLTKLREFIIPNNFLSGTVPSSFSNLATLEQLSLYDQHSSSLITGTIPSFLNAPRLWYFDVSNNHLTGSIPPDFMLNSVQRNDSVTVYLSNNEITGDIPTQLRSFEALDLLIVGNKITSLSNDFCSKNSWMQNDVGKIGSCDAIACPPGTFTSTGRQESVDAPCLPCQSISNDFSKYFGVNTCANSALERDILLQFYLDTGGASWTSHSLWRTTEPICSWEGILCDDGSSDDDSGVTGIWLKGNNLVGTVPNGLWNLPSLRIFDVQDNHDLFINIGGMPSTNKVEILLLSGTRIQSIRGVSHAQHLEEIHLTECGISGPFPQELFSLKSSLRGIFISFNSFSGTLPTQIGHLSNLENFYAFDNELSGSIPSEIGVLTNLQNLELSENLFFGSIPSEISSLPSLEMFSAFRLEKPGPRLSGKIPAFNENPNLSYLLLDGNALTGEIPYDFLWASRSIQNITLSHNLLSGTVPESIIAIKELNFQLEGNKISGFSPTFCNKTKWMNGAIKRFGCDGFLCKPEYFSSLGRESKTEKCSKCSLPGVAKYYGSTACGVPVDERMILLALFQACGGSMWYKNDGWTTRDDFCSWYGIVCENGSVTSINLGSNNLVGATPTEIYELPGLQKIELFSNPIQFTFKNIEKAKKLTTLRLDSTGLNGLTGISKAPALTFVDLRFNKLKGKLSEELFKLSHLRYLSVGNNKYSGTISAENISKLKFLKTLRMGDNEFSGELPAFEFNQALSIIDLSDNQFYGTIPRKLFDRITSTTPIQLDLSNNLLTGWVPDELDRFESLTLYLRANKISELPITLCDNSGWNGGDVGNFGCDGVLCPPGTFNVVGREREGEPCTSCLDGSPYYGQVNCSLPSSSGLCSLMMPVLAAVFTALYALQ